LGGRFYAAQCRVSSAQTLANNRRLSPSFAGIQPEAFRKKHNLWLAYASEIGAPVLRAVANARSRGPATPNTTWRRGLIIGHTHIGDVLYRTCSLPALREHLPGCEWTYLTSPGSAEILEGNPHVAESLASIRGEDSWILSEGAFNKLRSREFDVVLCSNTLRHYPDVALAAGLGIPNRVAFSGRGFSGLINRPVALPFPSPYAAYFRSMVAEVTGHPPTWPLRPRLYPSEANLKTADELWSQFGLGQSKPVVACSLSTRQARGNWPAEVLLAILEQARSRAEFEVVLCGTAADSQRLRLLGDHLPFDVRVLAGETSILEFAAFLQKCTLLLTLDSGPRHIGNAVGIPVLFARNLSHSMVEAGKYCETENDLAPPVEYLEDDEVDRVARAQPAGMLADKLVELVTAPPRRE
jgi:heptosyltransferase II